MRTDGGGYYSATKQRYYGKVIDLYQKGYGSKLISKLVPVCRQTITNWISIFAEENQLNTARMKSPKSQQPSAPKDQQDVSALQERIKELESQLKHERLRADFYNEMIDVAEAKFNIPIRKKAGAKR